jgi:hypothetical protein
VSNFLIPEHVKYPNWDDVLRAYNGDWNDANHYVADVRAHQDLYIEWDSDPLAAVDLSALNEALAVEYRKHDGETRMGPGLPLDDQNGFVHTMADWCEAGQETAAANVTGIRIRFPDAYTHYQSLLAAGQIATDDSVVPGHFYFYGPYSNGQGHITGGSDDGKVHGTSIVPDAWIATDVHFYPNYLGHAEPESAIRAAAAWNAAHDQGDDTMQIEANMWDDGLLQAAWQTFSAPAIIDIATGQTEVRKIDFNPQSGFYQMWKSHILAGHPIGVPTTQEEEIEDGSGRVIQQLSSGRVLLYNKNEKSLHLL